MKKFFAIAFIAATLVACGGGETTPASDAGTATETTTAPAPAPEAGTVTPTEVGTATPTTPQP
jgi:ABC-type glycerol-3-phosphate transport system substrate-binding protein